MCWAPIFIVFLQKLLKNKQTWTSYWLWKPPNLDQLLTPQLYVYIHIYMLSRQLGDHVFAFEEVNWWDAFAHRKTEIFRVTPFPPRVSSEFFPNCHKRRRRNGTHRKLITDPVSVLFFLEETRSTARGWRGPQVNFFPPLVSGPFYATLQCTRNAYFYSGFGRITQSYPELAKKHPRTNLRRSWKKTPLFSVKIFGKNAHKLIRDPWPFFWHPFFPVMSPQMTENP